MSVCVSMRMYSCRLVGGGGGGGRCAHAHIGTHVSVCPCMCLCVSTTCSLSLKLCKLCDLNSQFLYAYYNAVLIYRINFIGVFECVCVCVRVCVCVCMHECAVIYVSETLSAIDILQSDSDILT